MDRPERKDTAQRALLYAAISPAVILFTQVLMGVIVGALGVAVATPLAAAAMVAISMLYVEDALGDKSLST